MSNVIDVAIPDTLDIVVTGTGHCGTMFATSVLSACGLRAAHEGIFRGGGDVRDGPEAWEAEVSAWAAPYLTQLPEDITYIHLVRHPLDTLRSFYYANSPHGWAWRCRKQVTDLLGDVHPELHDQGNPLDWLCHFYLAWTDMIDRSGRIDHVIQIEDGQDALTSCLNLTAHKEVERIGRRKRDDAPQLRWENIPEVPTMWRLFEKATDYGYQFPLSTHWKDPT